ncbi:Nn.00g011110.m01.CDS01 [Neocucurbitaria sp. VM-36]
MSKDVIFMDAGLYKPLSDSKEEIRILQIQLSPEIDSLLECSFEIVPLDEAPAYAALSYVWGDGNTTETIVVNGVQKSVTVNLVAALRQLRAFKSNRPQDTTSQSPDPEHHSIDGKNEETDANGDGTECFPQYLWIDAICINQKDGQERSSQVELMGSIYSKAAMVLSWLGPERNGSTNAMAAVRLAARDSPHLSEISEVGNWLRSYPKIFGKPDIWDALNCIWCREYWERTWIIKETVLNSNVRVICGSESLDFDALRDWNSSALAIRATNSTDIPDLRCCWPLTAMMGLREYWRDTSYHANGLGFYPLCKARDMKATDQRDKVFGLIGLAKFAVKPDYSGPISDVYLETAIQYLHNEGLEGCLDEAGTARRAIEELPSWVPDWTTQNTPILSRSRWQGLQKGRVEEQIFHIDSRSPRTLIVLGFPLAIVDDLGPDPENFETHSYPDIMSYWQFTQRVIQRFSDQRVSSKLPLLQAIVRLAFVDRNILGTASNLTYPKLVVPSQDYVRLASTFLKVLCCNSEYSPTEPRQAWLKNLARLHISTDGSFGASFHKTFLGEENSAHVWESEEDAYAAINDGDCARVSDWLRDDLQNYKQFMTNKGFLGLGRRGTACLDKLFILKGCKAPVILRQLDTYYELIGTAHVAGIMNNELFEKPDSTPVWQKIEIH